jgi:pimeloyl-ACP methyl ester carboxylesterase
VDSFMRWLTFRESLNDPEIRRLHDHEADQMYLGAKRFRMPAETLRVGPLPFSDAEVRGIEAPMLLLIREQEVLYHPAALDRARRLIPRFEGELVPRASHDMSYSRHSVVDARILRFLRESPAG